MKKVSLEEKYILEYIRTMLSDAKIKSETVESDLFHHNSSYSKTPSIIRNGILSIKELNARGIERFSEKDLRILSDISSHINGSECVSLSLTGLKDLYQDESEYNPLTSLDTDILVSKEITARRSTEHYGNEYLVSESITPDKFKSVDKLGDDLYVVRAKVSIKAKPDDDDVEEIDSSSIMRFVVYKNKLIYTGL